MIILGIDPSIVKTGIALLQTQDNLCVIHYTTSIRTHPDHTIGKKLICIEKELEQILNTYIPEAVAIEKPFLYKAHQRIVPLCAAYGICTKVCASKDLLTKELAPTEIKKCVHGNAHANKQMVRKALIYSYRKQHDLTSLSEDEIDAVAIAMTLHNIFEQQNNMLV